MQLAQIVPAVTGNGSTVSYIDTVTAGVQYNYQVKAFNSGGATACVSPTSASATGPVGAANADIWQLPFNDGYPPNTNTLTATALAGQPNATLKVANWTTAVPSPTPGKAAWAPQAALATTSGMTIALGSGGTPGSAKYTYRVNAKRLSGTHNAGAFISTTDTGLVGGTPNGPNTLNGANYNIISWTNIAAADGGYDIYRTAFVGGNMTTTGKIGQVAANVTTFNDTGLTGDNNTPSNATTTKIPLPQTRQLIWILIAQTSFPSRFGANLIIRLMATLST